MTSHQHRHKMPMTRKGITHKVEIHATTGGLFEGYITANLHPDGTLGELFLAGFGKEGSTLEGWTQVAALLFSFALQYGAEFSTLARKLAHTRFEPCGPTSNPDIPYCHSVPDYIVQWLALKFGPVELRKDLARISESLGP